MKNKNIYSNLKESDFDGHTEFYKLSKLQRLEWLGELLNFVFEFKGIAKKQKIISKNK